MSRKKAHPATHVALEPDGNFTIGGVVGDPGVGLRGKLGVAIKKPSEAPKTGACAHPRKFGQCGETLGEGQYCFGCKSFICEKHGEAPWGNHKPEDHHEPCRQCGDRVEEAGADLCEGCS